MSKSKDSDHIDDMLEWENKQNTPWEYAQEGKLPSALKSTGHPGLAAILFCVRVVSVYFL